VAASYDYSVADQLTNVSAPGNLITTVGYDGLGRKASVSDPDLGLWRYTYDAAGNLVTQTDARGVTLWFGYDNLNRLTAKRQTDGAGPRLAQYWYDEVQTGYANLGRRTRAAAYEYRDGWGSSTTLTNTLAQSYDARGRMKAATRTVDGANYTTQYAYDPADRVIRITYPDNEQVTTVYGSQGQPASLSSTQVGVLADSASYDEANRLRSLRYPAGGGLVRRQVYYPWHQLNGRGRLQNLLVGTSATVADRLNLTYAYDAVGNVQSITDNGVLSSFGYDGLYQLTSAYGQSFSYDTASRITNFNGLIYTPDAQHPHAVNLVNGADRYDYDLNGNLVVRNKGVINQEQYLAWDYDNRLAAVTYTNLALAGGGGGTPSALPRRVFLPLVVKQEPAERYSYDADGARVRKESKTEITRVIGPHYEVVIAVASGQVLTTTKYYDFGGQRIAVRQNGTLSYLHGDHLGSTSVTTNNSGAATNNVRYFAYGGQRGTGSIFALPTDHGFTGQKLDRDTGLMYYSARYYDSGLGMFISPDPLVPSPGDPLSLNRYSYVRNQPLRYTDPIGMFSEDEIMKYLDVDTWEEVLGMFEEGGQFAGRWGVLGFLRAANLGDKLDAYDGCFGVTCAKEEWGYKHAKRASGILRERDGQLLLEGSETWNFATLAKSADLYHLDSANVWVGHKVYWDHVKYN
jgi:RHS repeat-associated protein